MEQNKKARKTSGFTLIELVIVIVILGILASVALAKYADLSKEATTAALLGITGNIEAASASNFAARTTGSPNAVAVNLTDVCKRTVVASFMNVGIPSTYSMSFVPAGTFGDCSGSADYVLCSLIAPKGLAVQTFKMYCAR